MATKRNTSGSKHADGKKAEDAFQAIVAPPPNELSRFCEIFLQEFMKQFPIEKVLKVARARRRPAWGRNQFLAQLHAQGLSYAECAGFWNWLFPEDAINREAARFGIRESRKEGTGPARKKTKRAHGEFTVIVEDAIAERLTAKSPT